jgi:cold shock CspA family protein
MNPPDLTATANLIAKLLAHRPTPTEEVGPLIAGVLGALTQLEQKRAPVTAVSTQHHRVRAAARRTQRATPAPLSGELEIVDAAPMAPPAPKLVRRAEVAAVAPPPPAAAAAPNGTVRGIVKWFDPRSGKGALRLPGFSGDVLLDARLLAESGIARLFKGQEVEATFSGGEGMPQLQRLSLPGSAAATPVGSGVVHSRHAKPVLVELKREALRRIAARAEAEHLLGRGRSR